MKIGILGSGSVAQTLGAGFLAHGHEVMVGSRSPDKLAEFAKTHAGAKVGTFEEAAKFGEALVLAVKGDVAEQALSLAGHGNLAGKPVVDATNPIASSAPVHGVLPYFTSMNDSLMERLQRAAPQAKFVKAFNSVGAALMVNPKFATKPTMFICGNDEGAKRVVGGFLDQFGWEVADMGAVEAARAIEPLCILWCIPGIAKGDWAPHAFKLLR